MLSTPTATPVAQSRIEDPALSLDRVTKRFGATVAVDSLSLRIAPGTIYGFLGQNGAGKTTTLRMVMSILYPDEGTLRVLGQDAEAIKDRLGYLPEEKGLYKKMTPLEVLVYFGRLKGMSAASARSAARRLLGDLGLGDWMDRRCDALSKGMGQKVQVLGTLIHGPDLVILDEPFSGLDPVNVEVMRELILDMKRAGRTVIFSTHIMEQAEQLCDSIGIIHRGRKRIDGSLADVKRSAEHTVRIDYDGDGRVLRSLPGVRRVNDAGKQAELALHDGADPQELLARLVETPLVVRRFDLREPSLHEIFVHTVSEAEGETAAKAPAPEPLIPPPSSPRNAEVEISR